MNVVVADIDEKLRLAAAAPISLVPATLARRLSRLMLQDFGAVGFLEADQDHVELRHSGSYLRPFGQGNSIGTRFL